MERQRLIKLIENKGTSSKEETTELWDIVRTFPYFQTARLLLAKSFHNQGSIHFHNELKTAAAYASDRKVLFHLINDEKTRIAQTDSFFAEQSSDNENNVFAIKQKQIEKEEPALKLTESYSENQFMIPEDREHEHKPVRRDSASGETDSFGEIQAKKLIEEKKNTSESLRVPFDEPSTTNEEIIRRRLSEILAKNKPEQEKKEELALGNLQTANSALPNSSEETTIKEEPVTPSMLDELPTQPLDEIEGLEIETIIEESYLQELEKLPEIVKADSMHGGEETVTPPSIQSDSSQHSFIDWLKQKNGKETTVEEVHDDDTVFQPTIHQPTSSPLGGRDALIDKFIATAPRIVPIKAEFYSPANMARQSIIDNEDIISETLARIYFDQGNYPKARSCYEKLCLLYPEKSASFAPLIEKIDDIIKNQT